MTGAERQGPAIRGPRHRVHRRPDRRTHQAIELCGAHEIAPTRAVAAHEHDTAPILPVAHGHVRDVSPVR